MKRVYTFFHYAVYSCKEDAEKDRCLENYINAFGTWREASSYIKENQLESGYVECQGGAYIEIDGIETTFLSNGRNKKEAKKRLNSMLREEGYWGVEYKEPKRKGEHNG